MNDDYYVLYGRGNNGPEAGRLLIHVGGSTPLPSISAKKVNPVVDIGEILEVSTFDMVKRGLIQTHGILMLLAWPLLACTGIFFASYMRPVLSNGEWFHIHRVLMLVALLVASFAFLLIFISQANSNIPGLIVFDVRKKMFACGCYNIIIIMQSKRIAHFIIGIIVMFLQILNVSLLKRRFVQ